jgi:hypothetical protein
MEEKGVKETKEVVLGFLAIASLMAKHFKDGVQVADFAQIMAKVAADEELKSKIEAAYKDVELVKSEVVDLSLAEGIELVSSALPEVLKLVEAVKA